MIFKVKLQSQTKPSSNTDQTDTGEIIGKLRSCGKKKHINAATLTPLPQTEKGPQAG